MRSRRFLLAFCIVCIGIAASSAHADIYGYMDADGIAHFSTEKLDERYQLFMQGNGPFDSSQAAPAAAPERGSALFAYLLRHPNLKKYEPLLHQAASEFSLDPALLKAVMAAESGFDPGAVSPRGAIGLMQVMPATAERYGLQADRKKTLEQKLADPKINIRLAARYLRDLQQLYPGQPDLVIASYNAGEGAVQRYNNRIPPFPETRNYVQLVQQFYRMYKPSVALSKRIHMTIPGRRNMPSPVVE